jgi:hypothetical protein
MVFSPCLSQMTLEFTFNNPFAADFVAALLHAQANPS